MFCMEKITKLRKLLEENKLDAILITNPVNRRYISGFTGTAGVAIVSQEAARFITDFRYLEQATEQAEHFTIVEHKSSIESEIKKQLSELDIQHLGFEKNDVTYASFQRYEKSFEVNLVPVGGLIENIRLIKTPAEMRSIKRR